MIPYRRAGDLPLSGRSAEFLVISPDYSHGFFVRSAPLLQTSHTHLHLVTSVFFNGYQHLHNGPDADGRRRKNFAYRV
jgi:hypothetical protein